MNEDLAELMVHLIFVMVIPATRIVSHKRPQPEWKLLQMRRNEA